MNAAGSLQSFAQSSWMPLAAALAAGLVAAVVLRGLKPAFRFGAAAAIAIAMGGILFLRLPNGASGSAPLFAGLSGSRPAAIPDGSATTPQQSFEETLFQTHPAYKTLATREPASWRETHRDIGEVLEVHGPDDPERNAGLNTVFQRLNTKLMHGAADAPDTPLLAWLAAETNFSRALQTADAPQCAEAALGAADLNALQKDAIPLYHAAQAALVDAYLTGGKTPVAPPEKTSEQALMRRAVDPGAHPFTSAELAQFINRAQQPPAVTCAVTLKFYDNVQAMPPADAAALLRAVLRTR